MHPVDDLVQTWTRRQVLQGGLGLGAVALSSLLAEGAAPPAASMTDPLAPRRPHFPARARSIIYLHMIGAPSQLDLYDDKPALRKYDGKECPAEALKGKRFAFLGGKMTLGGSAFKFAPHGKSGQVFSELLPHLGTVADHLCVIRTLCTEEINHAPAQMFLHTGFGRGGRPSLGAWAIYGLGSPCRDLPAYVVMLSGPLGGAGTTMWSAGFLPSVYQGVQFRSAGDPVLFLSNPQGHSAADRRRVLDAIGQLNRLKLETVGDPEIATRIEQYEMSFRMQASVPDLVDLSKEDRKTLQEYGIEPGKPSFATNCLLARRLVERGVRFIELYDADWDHHNNLEIRLSAKCKQVDRPMAALVRDLARRGLLDTTLVVWGAEFGRTPIRQGVDGDAKKAKPGRDHHKDAYTVWLAGGGMKAGISLGKTDELGFDAVEDKVHVHDLNATILHCLGIDHERLTYRFQGRDFRLTDVHGNVIKKILA